MKKILILLCLCVLFLAGCGAKSIEAPISDYVGYAKWSSFIWHCKLENDCSVSLQQIEPDGTTEDITVTFDGEKYTITDTAGTRSYRHVIIDRTMDKKGDAYHYGDYFFLTDDPDITIGKYQKGLSSANADLLPTELVLGKTGVADTVECYGLVPRSFDKVMSAFIDGKGYADQYCKNSFFIISASGHTSIKAFYNGELDRSNKNYVLNRYDYKGNLLCSVEIPYGPTDRITEFDDGSFIVTLYSYSSSKGTEVLYFSEKGELQWHYVYPAWHGARLSKFSQIGDDFYGFGGYHTGSYENPVDEIYIARFSEDGELLADVIAGGSGEESFVAAELSDNGFTLWGKTESNDGDFPVGSAKDAKLFHVEVGFDLTFSELTCPVQKEYSPYPYGYYKGNPVGWEDPLMQIKDSDRLPEKFSIHSTIGLIPWGTGYVILRHHYIEEYAFSHPALSMPGGYRQIIATYYNAFGIPVWQTVSEPFL